MNKKCPKCKSFDIHITEYPNRQDDMATCYACGYAGESNDFPKITNGDVIRQMSDGVLAFMMSRLILNGCPISNAKTLEEMQECIRSNDCTNCLKNYLGEEALVSTLEEVEKSEIKGV